MKIKILIVTDELEMGGTQTQILRLLSRLDRQRFESTVVFFRNRSVVADQLEAAGVRVLHIAKRRRIDLGFLRRFSRVLKDGGFHVVHAFSFTGELWTLLARLLARDRAGFISSVRGVYVWYRPWHWWIKRRVSRTSAVIVANSVAGADYAAAQMGLPRDCFEVVPNGVDEPPKPTAATAEQASVDFNVLFVGRLVPVKNIPCLLRACAQLRRRGLQLRVRIVGDGPAREELRALAAELDLAERVAFLGELEVLDPEWSRADCVVLPSHMEGLSNVLMEAMVAGRAVVASRVGGNQELVVHGQTGLLFEPGDVHSLAEQIKALIDDPALRARLGDNAARSMVRHFGCDRMVKRYTEIYERVARIGPGELATVAGIG